MCGEMRDEITHPFPNFNGATVEVWEWIRNFSPRFIMDVITEMIYNETRQLNTWDPFY